MTNPNSVPARTPDPSYWLIPAFFLRDTAVNVVMFLCLASAAFAVDWFVHWLSIWGLTAFPRILLEGTSYVLAVCDAVTFVVIQLFLMYQLKYRFRP